MAVSYKKLWKMLIDKDMKKKDLRLATGITTTALAKLGKNEHVNTEILAKICKVLECNTPSWICNKQNNLVDNAWFGSENIFNRVFDCYNMFCFILMAKIVCYSN